MEKIFVTIVVLYALFVGIYLLYLRAGKRRKKNIVGQGSSIQETGKLKADIVGKSRFDLSASKPLAAIPEPHTATSPKSENQVENPDTFAPSNEIKRSAEVPPEELDEAFSDTPPDEDNEPMDIDYPLEYEQTDVNENEPEDEEEEVEGTAQAALASGVQFDDLGNMVRTVNRKDEATDEQKKKAGNTLLEIRQTDMFEQVVSGKPDAKRIVTDLMAESLSAFYERKDKEAGTTGNGKKAPDSFNIRDFA
ncbi:hypothetical protein M2132_002197 [Dysgonomonas sp. PH5-45]|uniref:hypothetical protein n=1 Tax=unclassified Dysgonomonas TaxID=2630389 RepID=UPI002473D1D1|nr:MULTISPECIES: hypothetical protein [unclassified Dysgonomonas]MDH6355847.1 hypothetical protein [Dysgonomonas sp. PH5-45]MDH6388764.1 hypothetical protein [Dysgonomonas sp. PH5-37]